ncbi:NADH-quinone oxidoreductase subunit N [Actinomadura rupiterrae]|uniref:NADH-quinone oxidoreductase subunit N n=1 Tax=Actinomadura rupiterrae TaxID=559627 RepID=UPI0020A37CEC|nr:NADH-quinone oxidoreductase subunit N [Actinomadura rupiterrae]MCP2343826.1 NADH-quinone oxidoreductase subunit N [Actinomadura rupiterrae]
MRENPADLLPELCTLLGAVLGLLTGMFVPRQRQWAAVLVCALGVLAGLVSAAFAVPGPRVMTFDAFMLDPVTHVTRVTVLGSTLLVMALAFKPLRGHRRETEFHVLTVFTALGTVALGASSDLLVLVAAYLLASIPSYALAGFGKDAQGTEAALKYYLMGALFGLLMLTGVTLLYGLGRGTSYETLGRNLPDNTVVTVGAILLVAGLLFKAGGVPAHFWVPDVAEGASPVVAALVTTIPKIGAFAALFRLGAEVTPHSWALTLALVATATMTLGNLAAFGQDNVRRLLAYSTISQAGYLLVPVAMAGRTDLAEPALLYYIAAYALTNLGAFAVVVAVGRDRIGDYRGLAPRSPLLVLSLVICLLGLIGTPPTAVFVGKVLMLGAALDGHYTWLAVVAAVNTVASVFYYLRWIVPCFARADEGPVPSRPAAMVAYLATALTLVLGIGSGIALSLN